MEDKIDVEAEIRALVAKGYLERIGERDGSPVYAPTAAGRRVQAQTALMDLWCDPFVQHGLIVIGSLAAALWAILVIGKANGV